MSLRKALEGLPGDRATENLVRETLQLIRVRGAAMSVPETAERLKRPEQEVSAILERLAEACVLERQGALFAVPKDPVVQLDIDRFMRRAERHNAFVRSNVLKFRDRRGYR